MKYYITYTVKGFDGTFKQGPYEQQEIPSQKDDIQGYDGVWDVKVVPENEMPADPVSLGDRLQDPII